MDANKAFPPNTSQYFTLGKWTVNGSLNQLISDDKSFTIEPKMMDVLIYLCQNSDQTISAEQLLIACWSGTFYGDAPVQKCIAGLRKKLGCNSRQPTYIKTIHRRGYKIIADVNFADTTHQLSQRNVFKKWTQGSPYLGLNTFNESHASIYFGRTKAIAEVIQSLKHCIERHCHFLLLLGKSGSGKSSLIRAGVLPYLNSETGFSQLRVKQHHIVTPNQSTDESPTATLVHALNALSLIRPEIEISAFIENVEQHPEKLLSGLCALHDDKKDVVDSDTVKTKPDDPANVKSYQLLVVDQFEQFLLDDNLDTQAKQNLVSCINQLAQCENLLCIAMLRNDFYADCLDVKGFSDLKDNGRQYDLQAANPFEITTMIRNPALAAGLTFEHDEKNGEQLDEILLAAAIKNPDALPLLEYTLDLLYQQRSKDNKLLLSAYHNMGGIEGAIAQQAEKTFNLLPPQAQQCWDHIMHALVKIDYRNKHSVTARKVPISFFVQPFEKQFIQRFLDAQLFVTILKTSKGEQRTYLTDKQNADNRHDIQFITIAHEALLKHWQRISHWVNENSAAIHKRQQLADDCLYWIENNRTNDALLNSKQKVLDGLMLSRRHEMNLNEDELNFVARSKRYQDRKKYFLSFVVIAVFSFSVLSWFQSKQIAFERDLALSQSKRTKAISSFLTNLLTAQSPYVAQGKEVLVKDVLAQASQELNDKDTSNLTQQPYVDALLHRTLGRIYIDLGNITLAEEHLTQGLALYNKNNLEETEDYLGILFSLSRLYNLKGEKSGHLAIIKETIELSKTLYGEDHKDTLGALDNLGTYYIEVGDLANAELILTQVYQKRKQLFGEDFSHTLYSLKNLGRLYYAQKNYTKSERYLQLCLDKWLSQSDINNPYALNCMRLLSVTKQALGKDTEAQALLNKYIAVAVAVLGAQHPEVLSAKNSLAEIYLRAARIEK